jgi:hypothetical protein
MVTELLPCCTAHPLSRAAATCCAAQISCMHDHSGAQKIRSALLDRTLIRVRGEQPNAAGGFPTGCRSFGGRIAHDTLVLQHFSEAKCPGAAQKSVWPAESQEGDEDPPCTRSETRMEMQSGACNLHSACT